MKRGVLWVPIICMIAGLAQASLIVNGDFTLDDGVSPEAALGWNEFHSGGWDNRETSPSFPDPTDWHFAIGNAGGYGAFIWQDVAVADDGSMYKLSADAMLDAWWLNSGYIKIEFYDAGAAIVGEAEIPHFSQPNYDLGLPLANYSVTAVAPAGTVTVRSILGTYGEGGTARFDNAVLQVIPEPGSIGLILLGSAFLVGHRARRRGALA